MLGDSGQSNFLEIAGDMLDRFNSLDCNSSGIIEISGVSQHGMATASGLKKDDYLDLCYLSSGQIELAQIASVSKISIPTEVVEHFKHIKCHCKMGLFAEIGRAWLTIDSDIYIWTYENSRDVAYFDGLNHLISAVGIIKPKEGVFVPDIKNLLVLATTIEIVILGVTFDNTTKTSVSPIKNTSVSYDEMQLINKPIFVLSTDNLTVTCIKGTENGRIFFGGNDGCLYEVVYKAESNWLGKRCKKINLSQSVISFMVPGFLKAFNEVDQIIDICVDNSRNLLYTLSDHGTIEAWTLEDNMARRIARLTQNEMFHQASSCLKSIDESALKPVTAICPVYSNDSNLVNLIAVTQSGARFYFATSIESFNNGNVNNISQLARRRVDGLFLLHVRMPPGYDTPNTSITQPKNIHCVFQLCGTVLMVSSTQQDKDMVWSLNSKLYPYSETNRQFTESKTNFYLDGQVWDIAEAKYYHPGNLRENFSETYHKPNRIIMLTNQGVHIIDLLKPLNILQQILIACHNPHHDAVKTYFQIQSMPEACAMSIAIACLEYLNGSELSFWATQALLLYGDNKAIEEHLENRTPTNRTFGAQTILNSNQQSQLNVRYSAKFKGLYLHFARVIRPIWNLKCIGNFNQSSIISSDCNMILKDLYAFKKFLELNPVIMTGGMTNYRNEINLRNNTTFNVSYDDRNKTRREELQLEEKQSLESLFRLVGYSCEVINLWKILCEHQFETLFTKLSVEYISFLNICSFRELILFRSEICAALIVALINTYLNDNASLGPVSAKLREVCPTIYRHEDAVSHKATEIMMLAKNTQNIDEKEDKLQTALQLCKDAAPHIPLAIICDKFFEAEFYRGIIELCAICALKVDPNNEATYYNNNNDNIQHQGSIIVYTARTNCYKEIKTMLVKLYQNCLKNNQHGSDDDQSNESFTRSIVPIITMTLQIPDTFLHFAIYEWLLEHNLLNRWLDLLEPSLGEYLSQAVAKNPNNLDLANLLWKYYEKHSQHSAAAKILSNLATMHNHCIPIDQRYEYLARAVMCMRNSNIGSSQNGILLKDLEDKLEIARVQKFILENINFNKHIRENERKEAIVELNATLYEITDLYYKFADRFNLWECQLTVLNCANLNDQLLIESIWAKLLDEELECVGSKIEKGDRMISKVKYLGREYGTNNICFPITFLVHELEIRCCKLNLDPSPVSINILEMNIEPGLLLDVYSRLISLNERIWSTHGDENYLIKSCNLLSAHLANNPNLFAKNKLKIIAKIQDLTSACLNLLYTNTNTEKNLIECLIQDIRETQLKIQRS